MIAYLKRDGLLWDLLHEDTTREKLELYVSKDDIKQAGSFELAVIEKVKKRRPHLDVVMAEYNDPNYQRLIYNHEITYGMPYNGRVK